MYVLGESLCKAVLCDREARPRDLKEKHCIMEMTSGRIATAEKNKHLPLARANHRKQPRRKKTQLTARNFAMFRRFLFSQRIPEFPGEVRDGQRGHC